MWAGSKQVVSPPYPNRVSATRARHPGSGWGGCSSRSNRDPAALAASGRPLQQRARLRHRLAIRCRAPCRDPNAREGRPGFSRDPPDSAEVPIARQPPRTPLASKSSLLPKIEALAIDSLLKKQAGLIVAAQDCLRNRQSPRNQGPRLNASTTRDPSCRGLLRRFCSRCAGVTITLHSAPGCLDNFKIVSIVQWKKRSEIKGLTL